METENVTSQNRIELLQIADAVARENVIIICHLVIWPLYSDLLRSDWRSSVAPRYSEY